MKRSNTELSNIVTLDNIEDVGENFFRRTQPKGKLFKGPNWTAYTKESLGSIPREVEKALVADKRGVSRIGFSTQTERFFTPKDKEGITPGVGAYNISGSTLTGSSFYSSKGFGNGFASGTERFDESKLYYSKYSRNTQIYFFFLFYFPFIFHSFHSLILLLFSHTSFILTPFLHSVTISPSSLPSNFCPS